MTPRTRSSSSTKTRPKPSERSSASTSNSNPSAGWWPSSIAGRSSPSAATPRSRNTRAAFPSPTDPSPTSSRTGSTSARCTTGESGSRASTQAILDRQTFDQVQDCSKSNRITRRIKHSQSGALLQGKLFDDKGNRMGPSFSSKNGVRYRFYVSTALRGRKHKAGSVTRVSAPRSKVLSRPQSESNLNLVMLRLKRCSSASSASAIASNKVQIVLADAKRAKRPMEIHGPRNRNLSVKYYMHHYSGDPIQSW